MPELQRVRVHLYNGSTDAQGRRGTLQIFQVKPLDLALQPSTNVSSSTVESVLLSSGHSIPRIGLGTWKSEKGQVRHAVYEAVRAGYRHVDCAAIYENEHEVGAALQQAVAEKIVRREDVFFTSKLW